MKTIYKYGLIAGTTMVTVIAIGMVLVPTIPENYKTSEVIGYTTMVLCMSLVFVGIRAQREQLGQLSFKQGVWVGTQITGISSAIFGLFTYILYRFIDTEFVHEYYAHYKQMVRDSGASQEAIEAQLAQLNSMSEFMFSPIFQALLMSITVFLIGALMTIIASWFLRSK